MAQQEITCICCPVGCRLTVTTENGVATAVTGNQCKRGDTYGRQESVMPLRMVTAVAPVQGIRAPISLKTADPVPKDKIMQVMEEVRALKLRLPIAIGDVLAENVAGTGVSLVATKNLPD